MASNERESNEILDSSAESSDTETFAESEVVENFVSSCHSVLAISSNGDSYISESTDTDSTYSSTSSDGGDEMEGKEIKNFENCIPKDFYNDSQNINDLKICKNDSNNKLFDDEYPGDCKLEIRCSQISDVIINNGDSGRKYSDGYGRDSDPEQDRNSLEITIDSVGIKEESVEHSDGNHVEDCKSKHLCNLQSTDDVTCEKDSVQVIFDDDYPVHCKLENTENLSETTTNLIVNEEKSTKNFDNDSICKLLQTSKYSCGSCDDEFLVNCRPEETFNPSQTTDNLDKYSSKPTLVVINDRINNEEEIEQKSAVSSIKNSFSRILEIFSAIERNSVNNDIACQNINV